jgi:putative transposase
VVTFKGAYIEATIIRLCVRWSLAYPMSYRQLQEVLPERGITVDHSTIHRWVLQYTPPNDAAINTRHSTRDVPYTGSGVRR